MKRKKSQHKHSHTPSSSNSRTTAAGSRSKTSPATQHPTQQHIILKTAFLLVLAVFIGTVAFMGISYLTEDSSLPPSQSTTKNPSQQRPQNSIGPNPWYTPEQVSLGATIYQQNCMVCHGVSGSGTQNWQKPLANGTYPPPPLNGSAHTWHHPLNALIHTINKGGEPLGGAMPAFENVLTHDEKLAVIAYIQNLWPRQTYITWAQKVNSRP